MDNGHGTDDVARFAAGPTATRVTVRLGGHPGAREREALEGLAARLPGVLFELVPMPDPSEQDRALLAGALDGAIHSAEALPAPMPEGLDWFWLPWHAAPASSDEREGPVGLALTFRRGDQRFQRLRGLFCKAVEFVGAGAGRADTCTVAGMLALRQAEVCLYDSLLDPGLLESLPPDARRIFVGKRFGSPSPSQDSITAQITDYARQGRRVVRLKGGDPGVFGRLAEEIEALEALALPYRVIPGVSSLNEATTGTGILLTRRGLSRGFCAITPRLRGGGWGPIGAQARAELPIVLFMAMHEVGAVAEELRREGLASDTPAALVFSAGTDREIVVTTTLAGLPAQAAAHGRGQSASPDPDDGPGPGLIIIGAVAAHGYQRLFGALGGQRVLLTGSKALQERAARLARDLGAIPICLPLVRCVPDPAAAVALRQCQSYDWIVLTSPSSVTAFIALLRKEGLDVRTLPRLMACGPGTERELRTLPLIADLVAPSDFGSTGLLRVAAERIRAGERILRLRSDLAGSALADGLRGLGAQVDDVVLYRNEAPELGLLPPHDIALFASASAVDVYARQWGVAGLAGRTILSIGAPTTAALKRHGIAPDLVGARATVDACLYGLAERRVAACFMLQGSDAIGKQRGGK